MAERKQYFLRSCSGEVIHVPIQIQSANDTEFMGLLAHENVNTEENSDSSSDGKQNEDVVVGHSSTEQTLSSKYALIDSLPGSSNSAGSSVLEGSTQQAINLQILNHLVVSGSDWMPLKRKEK